MAVYTVFESTNMGSTKYAERIFDAVSEEDIENGTFGYLNGLEEGQDVVYKFAKGTKKDCAVVVADNPAWDEDTCKRTNQRKDKYVIPAGTVFRVRVVKETDEFSVSAEGFAPESQEQLGTQKFVTIDQTTGKLKLSGSATENAIMNAEVMRTRILGGMITTAAHKYGYTRKMYDVKVNELNVHGRADQA